jgi:hypothetical protein
MRRAQAIRDKLAQRVVAPAVGLRRVRYFVAGATFYGEARAGAVESHS